MLKLSVTIDEITAIAQYLQSNLTKQSGVCARKWRRFQKKASRFLALNNKLYYNSTEKKVWGNQLLEAVSR